MAKRFLDAITDSIIIQLFPDKTKCLFDNYQKQFFKLKITKDFGNLILRKVWLILNTNLS